ncbi:MAG: hypothetical protein P4M14_06560 [Gammaproteobacteria bacterium]|nr:hypothetical protein [Gammaproteobacteria bacterium]
MLRQNETKEKNTPQADTNYLPHILGPLTGALGSHIPRVWLNRAVYHTNFFDVLTETKQHWHQGLMLNLARCYASVLMQSSARAMTQHHLLHHDNNASKALATFAPALASTFVAITIETPFIRESTQQNTTHLSRPIPFTKFNLPLTAFYFCRELGFSSYLFGSQDLLNTLFITGYTAVCHKGIIWEATTDMLQASKAGTTPNFSRDGIKYTLTGLAKGNVYTHPTCRVPVTNPANALQMLYNLLSVSCGTNLFLYRFIHLNVLSMAFEFGGKTLAPQATNHFSFWQTRDVKKQPSQITPEETNKTIKYQK